MARELKPVSFNPDTKVDREMLEYIEELGVSFGSYVKLLIRKDMGVGSTVSNETNDTAEIASQLKELVSILKTGVKNKLENQLNSKESIKNTLDYIIDKISEQGDIQITIKR